MTTRCQALDLRAHHVGWVPFAYLMQVSLLPGQALLLTSPICLVWVSSMCCTPEALCRLSCSWWPVPHSHCLPDPAWFGHIPAWTLACLGQLPGFCCSWSPIFHCGLISPILPSTVRGVVWTWDMGRSRWAELRNWWTLSLITWSTQSFLIRVLCSLPCFVLYSPIEPQCCDNYLAPCTEYSDEEYSASKLIPWGQILFLRKMMNSGCCYLWVLPPLNRILLLCWEAGNE